MQALEQESEHANTRRELILLLAASFACVLVLALSLADTATSGVAGGQLRVNDLLILGALAATGALAIVFIWHSSWSARRSLKRSDAEIAQLRRSLVAAEAILHAEQQILVFWEQGQGLRIVAHTISNVPGVPDDHAKMLKFGEWLDPPSAADLKEALDRLFTDGKPFNLLLKTAAGGFLEGDGRAASGRAVLRLRDVAGYKRDLVRILDQHHELSRDIRSSRALLNALPLPVWLRSKDGRIDWVNKAYVKAVDAADEAEVRTRQIELLETRQRAAVELTLKRKEPYLKRIELLIGGERRTHDVVVLPLDDTVAGAAIDVAALVSTQNQLDRHVAAFDRTLDRVATAVASFGPDQRLIFFNEAYVKLWRLDRGWLGTRPSDGEILDRLRELSRLPAIVNYREWKPKWLSLYKKPAELEDWWHLPDGRMVHVVGDQRPDGGVTYLYDDATERLALESRYKTLIDVQRETLDTLKEGVAVFATDGRLKLFNSAFTAIWKLSRERLSEGPHIDDIIRHTRVLYDDGRSWAALARAVTTFVDEREPAEGQMVRLDGSVIDFASAPLPDGATLITFADVTASKRYERALIERNEALVAADRLKSQFISHISYELRTPLTSIIGFSDLMANPMMGTLNEKQRDYLQDISFSSRQLLSIIDDILDLATMDAGVLELKRTPISARAVLDTALLGIRERANRARLRIDIDIATDVGEFVADEARVGQVLYNVLSNAIGFSNTGGRIGVECWREDGMVAFAVEDQGIGIPKEQQRRVFERFESRSHGSKHRGAGLGLSIAKNLVELHGGTMSLESEPGRGTRVTVCFPEIAIELPAVEPMARIA